jgi:hypothetical protein
MNDFRPRHGRPPVMAGAPVMAGLDPAITRP